MGAANGGPFGCGVDTLPCCAKNAAAKGGDIVRTRPMSYPETKDHSHSEVDFTAGSTAWTGVVGAARSRDGGADPGGQGPPTGTVPAAQLVGGDGEETYEDGSTYIGQLADGRRHGRGVWTSPSEQYSGQWKLDQRDGHGRQTWQDGRVYEGQFKDGKFHGKGRMEWHMASGLMVYEGQYVDDLKHGSGRYVWPDNRVYDGEWHRGQRSGRANYINSNGQCRLGIWKDDKVERWLEEEPPAPQDAAAGLPAGSYTGHGQAVPA